MEEQIKVNPKLIFTCAIFFSIGMIIVTMFLIVSEISEAKKSCDKLNMKYNFKILQGHFCNERSFVKYNFCLQGRECNLIWVIEDSIGKINLTGIIK